MMPPMVKSRKRKVAAVTRSIGEKGECPLALDRNRLKKGIARPRNIHLSARETAMPRPKGFFFVQIVYQIFPLIDTGRDLEKYPDIRHRFLLIPWVTRSMSWTLATSRKRAGSGGFPIT